MARLFTIASLAAALVSLFVGMTASAQPSTADGKRRDVQRPTFPVPTAPAPDGFEFGTIDWQGWLDEFRKQKTARTGSLPDGAIVREKEVVPTLPVLLPVEPALMRSVRVFFEPNSYSASGDIGRANVTIYGTHVFRKRAPDDPIARAAAAADRKSTRLNSSHPRLSRMPSSA